MMQIHLAGPSACRENARPPLRWRLRGEVREALNARRAELISQGFATLQGESVVLQRDLLNSLRQHELSDVSAIVKAETGLQRLRTRNGESIEGNFRKRLDLTSGRFAMIETGLGFQLVPWSRSLAAGLGQRGAGTVRSGGGMDWHVGRKRGLER